MSPSPDLAYPAILDTIKPCLIPRRTESHAFLVWFLQHYYRLDETEAQDTVCDGPDDKGIDGVYVDENLETVDLFQCRLVQNPTRTLGDTQLKEFVGTLTQFSDPQKIDAIATTTGNTELANLLVSFNVLKKVKDGFTVRGIFITNIQRDQNAIAYLQGRDNLSLFDKQELESSYIPVGPTAPVGTPMSFDVFGYDCAQDQIADVKVIFAPLKGSEVIRLDGIASSELFAWNVRGSLGKTKVNKDIGRSLDDPGSIKTSFSTTMA